MRLLYSLLVVLPLLVSALPVQAQQRKAKAEVIRLNRQAMQAYTNLELAKAKKLLNRAVQLAQDSDVTGEPLALSFLNLGIVAVGGDADNARGMDYFVRALQLDPNIQLDPLAATPEVKTMFALAKRKASGDESVQVAPAAPPPELNPPGGTGRPLDHRQVPQQLKYTPIPVYIEMPSGFDVGQVHLFFKGPAMGTYARTEMSRIADGWGQEIPCYHVREPAVTYYIIAFGPDGAPVGYAGTATAPFTVPVVSDRTVPAPALPGRPPPESCGEAAKSCPAGVPGCPTGAQEGAVQLGGYEDSCSDSAECQAGLVCRDEQCVFPGDEGDEEAEGDAPRFFAHLGFTVGTAWVTSGMRADRTSPPYVNGAAPPGWVAEGQGDCSDNNDSAQDDCVEVLTPGIVPTYALRATVGYYLTSRLALAGWGRIQLEQGEGTFSGMLFGGRLQYLFTTPRAKGFHLAGFAGLGGGQISPKPPQQGDEPDKGWPFVLTGLANVHAGAVLGYRFTRNLGLIFQPEVHVMFPLFLLNVDFTAGVEVGF